jgi:hypothetical protein
MWVYYNSIVVLFIETLFSNLFFLFGSFQLINHTEFNWELQTLSIGPAANRTKIQADFLNAGELFYFQIFLCFNDYSFEYRMSGVSHVLCYSASSTVTDPSLNEGILKTVVALARLFRCKFVAPDSITIEILIRGHSLAVTGTGGGGGGSSDCRHRWRRSRSNPPRGRRRPAAGRAGGAGRPVQAGVRRPRGRGGALRWRNKVVGAWPCCVTNA